FAYPPTLVPQVFDWSNYKTIILGQSTGFVVLGSGGYFNYLRNSLVAAGTASVLCILMGSFGAYGLVRMNMNAKAKQKMSFWIISTRMMPPIAAAVPFYILFRNMNLLNNLLSIIITYTAVNLPFVIWMLQGFFREVPLELYEAARLDGCGPVESFVKVILPLSLPGVCSALVFSFIFSWNEFLFALILTGEETKTMPVAAASMWSAIASRWGEIATVGIVTILPVFALTLFTQKYFVKGMTFGAIK
ncbi:MAG TPA: carbohydrate ABC transporter permease, partial [Candidatus Ventricola intestinavium]|nr:carbohydrate ABC transporter permease [Candidatus Ventricola intestinavium]